MNASQLEFRYPNNRNSRTAHRKQALEDHRLLNHVLEPQEKSETDPTLAPSGGEPDYNDLLLSKQQQRLPLPDTPDRKDSSPRKFEFAVNCIPVNDDMMLSRRKPPPALSPGGKSLGTYLGKSPSRSPDMTPLTPSKAFTRPCKYYAQGFCVKGAACTFLHSTQDPVGLSDRLSMTANQSEGASVDPSKMFVRLCRYYIKGQCAKGTDCTFIHPTPEQLDAIKFKNNSSASPNRRKTERSFFPSYPASPIDRSPLEPSKSLPVMANRNLDVNYTPRAQSPRLCINTNASPNRLSMGNPAASMSPSRLPMQANGSLILTNINQTKIKTKPCKFFLIGQCLKGDQCTFIHDMSTKDKPRPEESLEDLDLGKNQRINSPRFQLVKNRAYAYNDLEEIEDYVAGLKVAKSEMVANSNVAAVVLTLGKELENDISNRLTEIHNKIKELNNQSENNEFNDFVECHSIGCTSQDPERVANDVRMSDLDFLGRQETLCQPRFAHIIRHLRKKAIIEENAAYLYQIEEVTQKYAYKYPYANVSMVFQKGDKGEVIEEVAFRGLFEKEHVILDRQFWDTAFKARAPPIYLPFYLTGEQLAKYPDSRRIWFCGAHSLFVPYIKDAELVELKVGDPWPQGADVPSKYAARNVPVPTLYIKPNKNTALRTLTTMPGDEGSEDSEPIVLNSPPKPKARAKDSTTTTEPPTAGEENTLEEGTAV